jgi:hypothetical protein
VNVAWVVLHCNAALELGTETAGTTCALSSSISGPESRNQASHVRASSVPTLYVPLAVDFAILGLIFGTARWSQKWDRECAFLLFFYFAVHAVPKMGPPGGPIFGTVFRFIF